MKQEEERVKDRKAADFEAAASGRRQGLFREFWDFARNNKKWWMIPIIVILLIISVLVLLGSTGAGPLIYPLF